MGTCCTCFDNRNNQDSTLTDHNTNGTYTTNINGSPKRLQSSTITLLFISLTHYCRDKWNK